MDNRLEIAKRLQDLIRMPGWADVLQLFKDLEDKSIQDILNAKKIEEIWENKGVLKTWRYAQILIGQRIEEGRKI